MNTPLTCPHDSTALSPMDFKHGTLHACATCKGCYLPGAVATEVSRIKAWFEASAQGSSAAQESKVACPEGHGPMRVVTLQGHELDVCMRCHGFWFDADELKRLQQGDALKVAGAAAAIAAGSVAATAAEDPTENSSASAGDVLVLVADVAAGVLAILENI